MELIGSNGELESQNASVLYMDDITFDEIEKKYLDVKAFKARQTFQKRPKDKKKETLGEYLSKVLTEIAQVRRNPDSHDFKVDMLALLRYEINLREHHNDIMR
jgi:hypothetical protein